MSRNFKKVGTDCQSVRKDGGTMSHVGSALARDYHPQTGPAGSESWPAVTAGTSVSGIVGGLLTLALR